MKSLLLAPAICLGLSTDVRAEFSRYEAFIPLTATTLTGELSIPAFDPSLGNLDRVSVCFAGLAKRRLQAENIGPSPAPITFFDIRDRFSVGFPGQDPRLDPLLSFDLRTTPLTLNTTAYDGSLDFGGGSGADTGEVINYSFLEWDAVERVDRARFVGTGNLIFPTRASGETKVVGPTNMRARSTSEVAVRISIYYFYSPRTQGLVTQ